MTITETAAHIDAACKIVIAQLYNGGKKEGVTVTDMILEARKAFLADLEAQAAPAVAPLVPAVEIRRSIRPEAIYCLECGTPHTSIKRHLSAQHGLTPDAYRAKWNLRPDYPMVTVAYSAKRSELAKANGLGKKGSH